ncbi:putative GPI-anchored protein [Candida albicans P76055]|nr:putative GPI-anchored protein [Candida albicans P76055]
MKFTKLICSSILLIIPTVMADDASSDTTIINTITITKTLYTPEESSSLLSVQLESEASVASVASAASEAAASAASIASVASEASAASLASELSALAKVTEVKADVINNYNATINSTLSSSTIAPKISSSSSSSSSKKHESITSVITSSTKDNASAAVTTKTGSATSKAGAAAMAGPVPILTNSIFTAGLLALAAVLL